MREGRWCIRTKCETIRRLAGIENGEGCLGCAEVSTEKLDLLESLFKDKAGETKSAKVAWSVDDGSREVSIKAHFRKDGVDCGTLNF